MLRKLSLFTNTWRPQIIRALSSASLAGKPALGIPSILRSSQNGTVSKEVIALPAVASVVGLVGLLAWLQPAENEKIYPYYRPFGTVSALDCATKPRPPTPTEAEYRKALDLAKLASVAYDRGSWDTVERWLGIFFSNIDDIIHPPAELWLTKGYQQIYAAMPGPLPHVVNFWKENKMEQGLAFDVLRSPDGFVVAFRGTEPLSVQDWIQDLAQFSGHSKQYTQVCRLARDWNSQLDAYNKSSGGKPLKLTFTGHSLGGGLATAAALATGCEAVAFDAAALSDATIKANNLNVKFSEHVTNYNVRGDLLSDWIQTRGQFPSGMAVPQPIAEATQYGRQFWIKGVEKRAHFKGALGANEPQNTPFAQLTKSFLCHSWHVLVYQLNKRQFASKPS